MKRTLPENVYAKQTRSDCSADSSPERTHPGQSESQTDMSGGTANNSIVTLVVNESQTGMSGGTAYNSIVGGVINVSGGRSPLQNLIAETIQKIKSINKHVSTHIEDVAYRHLTEKGCVVIRGRSGSGKSHLGYTLLQRVSKAFSRKPVKISSPDEWNYIPKRDDMTASSVKPTVPKSVDTSNYVVMIDDIFGSSNLIQHNLDQWRQKFDLVWPSVEDGTIWIVITSRPEIIIQAMPNLQRYEIIKKSSEIKLDEGKQCLTVDEKLEFISRLCGKSVHSSLRNEVASINTALGFPQCCKYFDEHKNVQRKGLGFFQKPFEFISLELNSINKDQPGSYYVLLLVLSYNGYLPIKELKTSSPSGDFKHRCKQIKEVCSLKEKPVIKEIAESLCGIYLVSDGKFFMFSHRSIHDVLFVDLCQSYPYFGIELSTPSMLVEFVRTKENKVEKSETVNEVVLDEDLYPKLANKLKEYLSEEDSRDIVLSHPSLNDADILEEMFKEWDGTDIHRMSMQRMKMPFYPTSPKHLSENSLLHDMFDQGTGIYCLSRIIMNTMPAFAGRIIQTFSAAADDSQSVLDEALTCAVYMSQNDLVEMLLSNGAKPSYGCFRVLAGRPLINCSNCFQLLQMMKPETNELKQLLGIAVQTCNVICLRHILVSCNTYIQDHKHLYSQYLRMCIEGHTQKICIPGQQSIPNEDRIAPTNISEAVGVVSLLLRAGGTMDLDKILILASCQHVPDTMMELLQEVFQIPDAALDDVQESWCHSKKHHQLLKSLRDRESPVQMQPQTVSVLLRRAAWKQCKECVSIFLSQSGVTATDDNGNTVFHYMVGSCENHCHEILELLIETASSKQKPNKKGQLPLHVATIVRCVKCVSLLLSVTDINAQDCNGDTIVHCLYSYVWGDTPCKQGGHELMQLFIDEEADFHIKNKMGQTALHVAAAGRCMQCLYLLVPVSDVNALDERGNTPLHCRHKHNSHMSASSDDSCLKTYQLLIKHGSVKHITNIDGQSALHLAARGCCTEGVKLLITETGVNARDKDGNTPLHYVHQRVFGHQCDGDCCEIHNVLVENGASAQIKNNHGKTALHFAAEVQCERSANILLPVSDINAQDEDGDTALHCIHDKCRGSRRTEIYKIFISGGADARIKNNLGQTALHRAAQRQTIDSVRLLLTVSDVNAQDDYGRTALHCVRHTWFQPHREDNCHELLQLFVDNKANGNLKDKLLGETVLHEAARRQCVECVRLLLHVTDANVKDYEGNTAAHCIHKPSTFTTAEDNCHEILQLLIEKGLDGHIRNNSGQTALHVTASKQCRKGVELLLAVSEVNAQDNTGDTALHYLHSVSFCKDGCDKIYQLLMDKGSDVQLKNKTGMTALHRAARSQCTKCVTLLRHDLDVNAQDEDGNTAVHYIHDMSLKEKCNCRELYQLLFVKGADGRVKNKSGQTPLHCAAREQCGEGVSLLLPMSDVNCQDNDGNTPLHCVFYVSFGTRHADRYRELYQLLTDNGADVHIENGRGETAEQLTKRRQLLYGEITEDQI